MKKSLLGTTALVAAGLVSGPAFAADPLHLELGGYFSTFFGFTSTDDNTNLTGNDNTHEIATYLNSEIYFQMVGELDNGLTIGGRIELEGETNGDQIDQTYVTVTGGFGQLRLGAVNSGRYSYGWSTDPFWGGVGYAGVPINSGWQSNFGVVTNTSGFRFRSPAISTVIDGSNDEQKITYFTPRFNGFQLTASYTPQGHRISSTSIGQGGGTFSGATGFTGPADETVFYTDGLDFGAQWSGDLGGVSVTADGGFFYADAPTVAEAAGFDDYWGFNGGLIIIGDLGGGSASLGGQFASVQEGMAVRTAAASSEGESYTVGAGYATGAWRFSATYFHGEAEELIAVADEDERDFVSIGIAYDLGAGVDTNVTFLYIDDDAETGGAGADNEALAVIWGWWFWF